MQACPLAGAATGNHLDSIYGFGGVRGLGQGSGLVAYGGHESASRIWGRFAGRLIPNPAWSPPQVQRRVGHAG